MAAPALAADHEKAPIAPVPKGSSHSGAIAHRVKDGENWWSLAKLYNFSDAWSIIKYNFQTSDPREINWYLREYVGCNVKTPDGKNWRFSSSAWPGIIYVPPDHPVAPPICRFDKVWLGAGIRVAKQLFASGNGTFKMYLYNLESIFSSGDYVDLACVEAEFASAGVGMEAGVERCAVAAVGFGSAIGFCGHNQTNLHWGGAVGLQSLGGSALKEFFRVAKDGARGDQNTYRKAFLGAFGSASIPINGAKRIYFRGDNVGMADFSVSVQKLTVKAAGPTKIRRSEMFGLSK